jgi:hypothetical protein
MEMVMAQHSPDTTRQRDENPASDAAKKRADEQIEHDQDRDPPRTAVPPASEKSQPGRKTGH